ncbi:MAG: AAA family ATPase [Desulfobulbus oligotrophicus]|jgi:exonuclease SbcC|nr:AAA family ATPase [Desulfobulbus oligotrophicus]
MRILQIRFKNLNSLFGEWEIDLTHPAYTADGIFAITGPTGAGKSTVLDAVCLALYGRTPRLNRVTKSTNEIMSRRTGECFAEVTFETQAGRFRSHWSQHRARRSPDGELQAPKHEIAHAETGAIVESKIREVAEQIESVTGMDFDRFTRSMLLAQGGFAAFLQAAPDDRAPILEQITGTAIYSRISVRVHEQKQQVREKLAVLEAETAGIVVLTSEQEQEIGQTLEIKKKEAQERTARVAVAEKGIAWRNTINALQKERIDLINEANRLHKESAAFQPERDRLNQAMQAALLDGTYARLITVRKQQADDQGKLVREEKMLPQLEAAATHQAREHKAAEQQTMRVKEELKKAAPVLQKVRLLDQRLADQQQTVAEGEEECRQDALKIEASRQALAQEQHKRIHTEQQLQQADQYLSEHAQDEWLISGLTGVEEQLQTLCAQQQELVQKERDYEQAVNKQKEAITLLAGYQKHICGHKEVLEKAVQALQQGRDSLRQVLGDRQLREYRTEKDGLLREMAYVARITELEEYRARLEDGRACPLCGALEHPFAKGNVPAVHELEEQITALTRLINKAEDQETVIRKLEKAEGLARERLAEAEKLESAAVHAQKTAATTCAVAKESLEKLCTAVAASRQIVTGKLQPLGIPDIGQYDVATLVEILRARLHAWLDKVKQKDKLARLLVDSTGAIKQLDAIVEAQDAALIEKTKRLGAFKTALTSSSDERKALYGTTDPDAEERRLSRGVADAERAEKLARERYSAVQQQQTAVLAHIESLQKNINQRGGELHKHEVEFLAELRSAGFTHETQVVEAMLPAVRRAELSAQAKKLDDRQTDLNARQEDREKRLAREMSRQVTDKSLQELELQRTRCEALLKESRDAIAGLEHRLKEHAVAKERIQERQAMIAAQKKDCRRWENLHELIGSADGKKYRNFAQGLTFDIMIGYANRQLQKMSDRYLLIRNEKQPLDLDVIDTYQASEVRSTRNLSGGESFIVSLALALGLSQMAGKNVRVDSLFLDEGFGTLDEEVLDTALEALSGLQQDGKLIGVISHVAALKDRISTQIQISPRTGGQSQIQGPGCQRIASGSVGS